MGQSRRFDRPLLSSDLPPGNGHRQGLLASLKRAIKLHACPNFGSAMCFNRQPIKLRPFLKTTGSFSETARDSAILRMAPSARRRRKPLTGRIILILPAPVNRMPPKTSSMYPSSISRALCSDGMRCIKPLAPSRNETNSSRVNGGAAGAILGICSYDNRNQAEFVRPDEER